MTEHVCDTERPICPCGKVNLAVARTVGVAPSATPTRTPLKRKGGNKSVHNSWERGLAVEERPGGFQMPYLGENGEPVGVKEFAQRRNTGAWDHPGVKRSS